MGIKTALGCVEIDVNYSGLVSARCRAAVAAAIGPLLVLGAALTSPAAAESAADPDPVVLIVNSAELNASGDCTGNDVCTLRRAIEIANQTDPAADVLIEAEVDGTIPFPTAANDVAETSAVSPWDTGVVFSLKRPMEIDLHNRLGLAPAKGDTTTKTAAVAAMLVDAPGVKLRNFSDWFSQQSVFVFSANSDGSSLVGGKSIQTASNHTNRQVVIMAGAQDITISQYTTGRQASDGDSGGIALTRLASDSTGVIENVTISEVVFDNETASSAKCDASNGTGCSANGVFVTNGVAVDGLTLKNSQFRNFWRTSGSAGTYVSALNASAAGPLSNWEVTDNQFSDTRSGTYAAVQLPKTASLPGPVHIRRNVFDNSMSTDVYKQKRAIYFQRYEDTTDTDNQSASGLFIEDNYFDGYSQTIDLLTAGTVTVQRNTFGPKSNSVSSSTPSKEDPYGTAGEESGTSENVMVNNDGRGSNHAIRTWWPKAASIDGCGLSIELQASSTAGADFQPRPPVDIDVYWTAATTAEVYLGTLKGLEAPGTYTLDGVSPGAGRIRVQTQGTSLTGAQPESSQYSRVVGLAQGDGSATCEPGVGIALTAWTDVPPEATSYDAITASEATELVRGSPVEAGAEVWFTYLVTNTGQTMLRQVVVTDSEAAVCVVTDLPPGKTAGCARRTHVSRPPA
ncbi:MAG: hypothetical protein LBD90_00715 [Bifidobacteriaceae bacterium]|jgi:hypothetical protein|nr:hypothetical protein [Bifidobacteriaceae bacterium]